MTNTRNESIDKVRLSIFAQQLIAVDTQVKCTTEGLDLILHKGEFDSISDIKFLIQVKELMTNLARKCEDLKEHLSASSCTLDVHVGKLIGKETQKKTRQNNELVLKSVREELSTTRESFRQLTNKYIELEIERDKLQSQFDQTNKPALVKEDDSYLAK